MSDVLLLDLTLSVSSHTDQSLDLSLLLIDLPLLILDGGKDGLKLVS